MTPPVKLKNRRELARLERNLRGEGKRMIGREILPGVVLHVAEDIKPETIEALKELAQCVMGMTDEDLKEVEVFAEYLKSKKKKKVGRPRKL